MKIFVRVLILGLVSWLGAAPLPVGKGRMDLEVGVTLEVFTYKPAGAAQGPLLVVFHGVQRNADEYRDWAVPLADKLGAIVVAPRFDRERFPTEAYQRGGITNNNIPQPPEKWTFALVPRLVKAVRSAEGRPDWPYLFIGHSAGGQFLVRMVALAGPLGAERVVAANPGSHLFPTRAAPYGYGFGGLPEHLADEAAIERYVAAPLVLLLGTGDNDPAGSNLDRSESATKQGPHRYARGLACFAAAEALARERGWPLGWRKVEVAGIGHSAQKMFAAPEAVEALTGGRR